MTIDNLTAETLEQATSSNETTIVDFWAEWCGPCKTLSPILESLSDKYEGTINVAKVNIGSKPELAKKFNISSIPCLIVFRDGKEVERSVGFKGHNDLEELFSRHSGA